MSDEPEKKQVIALPAEQLKNLPSEIEYEIVDAEIVEDSDELVAYVGPLPPASEMEGYERTLEGSANRIITVFENEQQHRHGIENKVNRIAALVIGFQEIFSYLIPAGLIFVAILAATQGLEVSMYLFGGSGLAAYAAKFIQIIKPFFKRKKQD